MTSWLLIIGQAMAAQIERLLSDSPGATPDRGRSLMFSWQNQSVFVYTYIYDNI